MQHRDRRQWLTRHRHRVQAGVDAGAAAAAVALGTWLRYGYTIPRDTVGSLVAVMVLAVALQVGVGVLLGLYRRRWSYGSFEEVAALAQCVVANAALLTTASVVVTGRRVPTGATLIAAPFALVAMAGARYLWRLEEEHRRRPDRTVARSLLVFGAGGGGRQTLDALLLNPASPWYPVALLDDDPALGNLSLRGVRVAGDRTQMAEVAERTGATALVIAIPSASSDLLRELSALATETGLQVLVLPRVDDLLGAPVAVDDIRPLTARDLLGRRELDTDVTAIAGYLSQRRVLVTGAGGSIGSELCRQIHRFDPAALMMLDRDESALHGVQLSIEGQAMLDDRNLIVADIRDSQRMFEVFDAYRPDVVFHAAALKHLPLLEMHPDEAVKTNVWGTQGLLDQALRYGVERFVNISTDKAADPCSVLGYTKRIAERLTAAAVHETDRPYLSVRFGNVLGSRGSVLTAFRSQIESGGPVTVTHPDVTRYFMTVEEAVQLVIQAGAVGGPGEVLVLDMGTPVRIEDVARQLIKRAGGDIDIVHTGLRPGEKLHEHLFSADERGERRDHPLIYHVTVNPLDVGRVAHHLNGGDTGPIGASLAQLCTVHPEPAAAPPF
jgi:FlaA1/EpsC-like NDP-sugar epimerase